MAKAYTVIYDSLNELVWVDGEEPVKGSRDITIRYYGKSAKKFKDNRGARAYAIRLAKQLGVEVYDKYFNKMLEQKPKTQTMYTRPNPNHDPLGMEQELRRLGFN